MQTAPLAPDDTHSPAALERFLTAVQEQTKDGPRLVSIAVEAERLDPLAVLESIHEPGELHFYAERPARDFAVAGAEAAVAAEFAGRGRFAAAETFVAATLARTVAVGDLSGRFSGPLFFATFAFAPERQNGVAFPAARVFVPRWQVARAGDRSVAVANVLIEPSTAVAEAARRIWRAHAKFRSFDYLAPNGAMGAPTLVAEEEVGGAGGYERAVAAGLAAIAAGRYRKIVPARARDLRAATAWRPLAVLNGLRSRFPDCYAFSVGDGRGGAFIGASPETLVSVSDGALQTEALAGSAARGRTAGEDAALASALLRSGKDRHEHRLVLESIVRRLQRVGVEPVVGGGARVRQLSNVQHLLTPVTATVPAGVGVLRIACELHPTPAVGGTPREAAMAHLQELEPFDRGLFAGALGWVNHRAEGEFFVGIRSAAIAGTVARIFAGAGVVEGSEPAREFRETELKLAALRDALLGA
jgi:menaquinone-specific isochorismate synthase